MNIGVLGTGMVGNSIASKLVAVGNSVMMGSRTRGNDKAVAWVQSAGAGASEGSFADAAAHGEIVVNCTGGNVSLDALRAAGAQNLDGKVLVDISNALDFSRGYARLTVCNDDSLGEQIQREFPAARVVKTLNTMNHLVMIDPSRVSGDHVVFLSGDDDTAKESTAAILESFGWPRPRIVDLGGIITARGVEMAVLHWINLRIHLDSSDFNLAVCR